MPRSKTNASLISSEFYSDKKKHVVILTNQSSKKSQSQLQSIVIASSTDCSTHQSTKALS